jgi:hypothetical protein
MVPQGDILPGMGAVPAEVGQEAQSVVTLYFVTGKSAVLE